MASEWASAVSVSPVISEEIDPIPGAVLDAILSGTSIVNNVMVSIFGGGFSSRAEAFYKYGRDHYVFGLPKGLELTDAIPTANIKAAIDTNFGEVRVTSANYEVVDPNYLAAEYFQKFGDLYSFNDSAISQNHPMVAAHNFTFTFSHYIGGNKYSEPTFIEARIVADNLVIRWERTSYAWVDTTGGEDAGFVGWVTTVTELIDEIPIPGILPTMMAYHALFALSANYGHIRYWTYIPELGHSPIYPEHTYPTLLDIAETEKDSPFFPMVPIRKAGQNVNSTYTAAQILSCEKILDTVGVDLDTMTTEIEKSGDLSIIYETFIGFTVDIMSQRQEDLEYLYLFFNGIYARDPAQSWEFGDHYYRSAKTGGFSIKQGAYKTIYEYGKIDTSFVTGSIGAVGTYASEPIVDVWYSTSYDPENGENSHVHVDNYIVYKLQVSATKYNQISIKNLLQRNRIYHKDATITLDGIRRDGSREMHIPISYDILNTITDIKKRDLITMHGLSVVVFVLQETELDWWETADFALILQVVAFFYAVFSFNPYAFSWAAALAYVATAVVLNWAVRYVVEEIGGEAALALAAILTVAQIAFGGTPTFQAIPFAAQVMMTVTALINATNAITKEEFADLEDESAAFLENAEARMEELQEVSDMLGTSDLDPFTLLQRSDVFNPNESPDQFYERTTHTINPGVLVLDAIGNYVSNALELPKANDLDLLRLIKDT